MNKETILGAFPPYPLKLTPDEPDMPENEYKIFQAGYHFAIDALIKVLDELEAKNV